MKIVALTSGRILDLAILSARAPANPTAGAGVAALNETSAR